VSARRVLLVSPFPLFLAIVVFRLASDRPSGSSGVPCTSLGAAVRNWRSAGDGGSAAFSRSDADCFCLSSPKALRWILGSRPCLLSSPRLVVDRHRVLWYFGAIFFNRAGTGPALACGRRWTGRLRSAWLSFQVAALSGSHLSRSVSLRSGEVVALSLAATARSAGAVGAEAPRDAADLAALRLASWYCRVDGGGLTDLSFPGSGLLA